MSRQEVQVVDFFSGCGGMSYGFAVAKTSNVRYIIKGALDIDKYANATYQRMLKVSPLEDDLFEYASPSGVRKLRKLWKLDEKKQLIVLGCAPCQGFSSHRKKDPRFDKRNRLLEHFAKIAVMLKPDLIVMENVPEIFQEKHWRHFVAWRRYVEGAGYHVRAQVHNLAQFGVPQERYRAIVIASRRHDRLELPHPILKAANFKTVRDAISHLPRLAAGEASKIDPMHVTSRHRPETLQIIKLIPKDGGSRRALPEGVGPNCFKRVDGFRDVYGRLFWDRPAVAITARCRTPSCGRYTHPEQDRGLSVREASLLQGFPDGFFFEGPFDDKFKQIGNAVSPTFSQMLASHIDKIWKGATCAAESICRTRDVNAPFTKSFSSGIASMKRRLRTETI
jgi:DNA (cytosine-5)-methyltransferase 1